MGSKITWDPGDSAGQRTLEGGSDHVRFNGWRPRPEIVGEEAQAIGDGVGYKWEDREDHLVTFVLPNIDHRDIATLYEFLEWANRFQPFAIETDDYEDNEYAECQVAVGTPAEISDPDPETGDYDLFLTIVNIAIAPTQFRRVLRAPSS